jgi:hypothetical protein
MPEISQNIIDELDALQAKHNDGRGIQSVRSLINCCLKRPHTQEQLQAAIYWDWDKIAAYSDVAIFIKTNIFDSNTMYVR